MKMIHWNLRSKFFPIHARSQSGQTLIEAVVSLAVIILIISGISVTAAGSLSNASYLDNQNQASKYAQEGIEAIRFVRNNDYKTFSAYPFGDSHYYCYGSLSTDGTPPVKFVLTSPKVAFPLANPQDTCSTNITPSNSPNQFVRLVSFQNPYGGSGPGCPGASEATVIVLWSDGKCPTSNQYCQQSTVSACFTDINGGSSL